MSAAELMGGGLNPLVDAAASLLALVGQLRGTTRHPDVGNLHGHVAQALRSFETQARAHGASPETVLAARYALCTTLDETVLSTPWGSNSIWSGQTLLSMFHNETWGGEKFFQILDRLAQEPARNLHLLELMYICLALGFEGRYRVQERGRAALEAVQDNLYRTIRMQRGEFERNLSPRWRGVEDRRSKLARYVPLWVVGVVAVGVLLALYVGFSLTLNSASDPVFRQVYQLGRDSRLVVNRAPPVRAPPTFDLRRLLAEEERRGLIELKPPAVPDTVVVFGEGLFRSGSAAVEAGSYALLQRIGEALSQVPGTVLITGHTDNVPIRYSPRFPSNWHLSQKRAEAVVQILAEHMGSAERLVAEGRADNEPLVPNDSPANRARNRRVEITLRSQAGAL